MEKIKYKDYKTVIKVVDSNGKPKVEFTTWRADILIAMVEAGRMAGAEIQIFEPGDTFSVQAAPSNEDNCSCHYDINECAKCRVVNDLF